MSPVATSPKSLPKEYANVAPRSDQPPFPCWRKHGGAAEVAGVGGALGASGRRPRLPRPFSPAAFQPCRPVGRRDRRTWCWLSVLDARVFRMTRPTPKADLLRTLRTARETLLWKLEGLSEYDVRRPMTPTGTNLLGLVKHSAGVEVGYFGDTFGRPFFATAPLWMSEAAELNSDMWASADETREEIIGLYREVWRHSDATIAELSLESVGYVPWRPGERTKVTLHQILVHVIADITRHAGHADIVRELIDGSAGMWRDNDNMPPSDQKWWEEYRGKLERVAREADQG